MNEIKVEIALEILQLKIINYIKNFNGNNIETFQEQLKKFKIERENIYKLNEETINKVYDIYLKEIKKGV